MFNRDNNMTGMAALAGFLASASLSGLPGGSSMYNHRQPRWHGDPRTKMVSQNTEPYPEGEATPEQRACKPRQRGKGTRAQRRKSR